MVTTTSPTTAPRAVPAEAEDRALPRWGRRRVLGVWAAAALPMGVLGWLVTPWLGHHVIGGRDPFVTALLIAFNAGLLWQLGLVLALVRREQGSLAWPVVRDALRLRAPRDPRTRRRGGRVWLMSIPFVVLSALVNFLPIDPTGPLPRDFPKAIGTDRVADYFHHNPVGFALLVLVAFLSPIVEELLFRGLLLPRMRSGSDRRDSIANGALFALYHVHQPWSMPAAFIDGTVNQAWASRRYASTWMGLITHTAPSFLTVAVVLALVL